VSAGTYRLAAGKRGLTIVIGLVGAAGGQRGRRALRAVHPVPGFEPGSHSIDVELRRGDGRVPARSTYIHWECSRARIMGRVDVCLLGPAVEKARNRGFG